MPTSIEFFKYFFIWLFSFVLSMNPAHNMRLRALGQTSMNNFIREEINQKEINLFYKGLQNLTVEQAKQFKRIRIPNFENIVPLSTKENELIMQLFERLEKHWKANHIADFDKCFNLYDEVGLHLYGKDSANAYQSQRKAGLFKIKTKEENQKCRKIEDKIHKFIVKNASSISPILKFDVGRCDKFMSKSILC